MGVTYKIKPEVIAFIVEQKKANPAQSCRSLVDIVQSQFNVALSKSSINAILKQHELSSPVGRHGAPTDQRSVLSQRISQALRGAPVLTDKDTVSDVVAPQVESSPVQQVAVPREKKDSGAPPQEEKDVMAAQNLPQISAPRAIIKKEDIPPAVFPLPQKPPKPAAAEPPAADALFQLYKNTIERITQQGGATHSRMGSFLLKAALYDVSTASLLSNLMHSEENKRRATSLDFLLDIALYAAIFKQEPLALWESSAQTPWLFCAGSKPPFELFDRFVRSLEEQKDFPLAFHSGYSRLFRECNTIKLTTRDSLSFYIDGRFKSIWLEPQPPGYLSAGYEPVVRRVKSALLEDSEPVVLCSASGQNEFSKAVELFVLLCSGIPEAALARIELRDHQNNPLEVFADLPPERRSFILGCWPWQRECARIIEQNHSSTGCFFAEELGRDIYYATGDTVFEQHTIETNIRLRYILLKDSPVSPVRLGVLTNVPEAQMSAEKVAALYLRHWPNLEESYQDYTRRRQQLTVATRSATETNPKQPQEVSEETQYALPDDKARLYDEMRFLAGQLSGYAQRHFLPHDYRTVDYDTLVERFFSLEGRMKITDNACSIMFLIAPDYGFTSDLMYMLRRLNESDIKDHASRRIIFYCSKKTLS